MDERIARLRAHQNNIERYRSLLKTELSEVEMHYLEKCLSEERLAMAILRASVETATGVDDREILAMTGRDVAAKDQGVRWVLPRLSNSRALDPIQRNQLRCGRSRKLSEDM